MLAWLGVDYSGRPGYISVRPRRSNNAGRVTMDVETTPTDVETTQQPVDELLQRLDQVTAEQREQDAEGVAAAIFTLLCPHCAKRREAKRQAMQRWRANKRCLRSVRRASP